MYTYTSFSRVIHLWTKHRFLPYLANSANAKSLQLCPTLCSPVDCSLPGSSLHGILQARILEWIAIPFSRRENLIQIALNL